MVHLGFCKGVGGAKGRAPYRREGRGGWCGRGVTLPLKRGLGRELCPSPEKFCILKMKMVYFFAFTVPTCYCYWMLLTTAIMLRYIGQSGVGLLAVVVELLRADVMTTKKYLIAESESASVAPIHQQFWPESSTRLGRTSISASL